jgi:hypothetical protein
MFLPQDVRHTRQIEAFHWRAHHIVCVAATAASMADRGDGTPSGGEGGYTRVQPPRTLCGESVGMTTSEDPACASRGITVADDRPSWYVTDSSPHPGRRVRRPFLFESWRTAEVKTW